MPEGAHRRLNRALRLLPHRPRTCNTPSPIRCFQARQHTHVHVHESFDRQQGIIDQGSTDDICHIQSSQSSKVRSPAAARSRPLSCHVPMGGGGRTRTQTQLPSLGEDMDPQLRYAPPTHPIAGHCSRFGNVSNFSDPTQRQCIC